MMERRGRSFDDAPETDDDLNKEIVSGSLCF